MNFSHTCHSLYIRSNLYALCVSVCVSHSHTGLTMKQSSDFQLLFSLFHHDCSPIINISIIIHLFFWYYFASHWCIFWAVSFFIIYRNTIHCLVHSFSQHFTLPIYQICSSRLYYKVTFLASK